MDGRYLFLFRWYFITDNVSFFKDVDLCQVLVDALDRNCIDFIELFMNYGASLENLTLNNLEQLYTSPDVCVYVYPAKFYFICLLYRSKMDCHWERRANKVYRQEMLTILAMFPIDLMYVFIQKIFNFESCVTWIHSKTYSL